MSKVFDIFKRDVLSSTRNTLAIYMIIVPIILAVVIALSAQGLNDTAVKVAMLEDDTPEHIEFMRKYAKVELFNSVNELERRIMKRDEIAGLLPKGDGYEIIVQGNEPEMIEVYTKTLSALYELGVSKEDSRSEIYNFNRHVPPVKKMLVIMLISITIMLAGMLISFGIVEEKTENTINAINVTPVSQNGFIIGKSALGGTAAMASIVISIIITGFYDINWLMIILVGVSSLILSVLIGFLQGLNSKDVMEASTGVKVLLLPIAGSIAGYELLADKWQWTMYWSPFYWAYKANDMILSKTADWPTVLLCTGLVLVISLTAYLVMMPKIRKGLS